MFVDELTIEAKAGNGGNGVVRWNRMKYKPKGGPAGGNGGNGGSVYIKGVRDLNLLSKYTGSKAFMAENGVDGKEKSQFGKHGDDLYIKLPIGSVVTNEVTGRVHTLDEEGDTEIILHGGSGGLGNEYFKSSTNQTPEQSTEGKEGEGATFHIELSLVVDVGVIGFPNAGKSTLLNTLTNATAAIGAYPFTTLEPHLGALYEYTLADVPGLIEGASGGKGLGHKFLRHVQKTKMLLHCISFENEDIESAYQTIRNELVTFDAELPKKLEWVVLTKSDLVGSEVVKQAKESFEKHDIPVFALSAQDGEGVKEFRDALVNHLRSKE